MCRPAGGVPHRRYVSGDWVKDSEAVDQAWQESVTVEEVVEAADASQASRPPTDSGLTESGGLWYRRADSDAALRTLYIPASCDTARLRLIREAINIP